MMKLCQFAVFSLLLAPGIRAGVIHVKQDGSGDALTIVAGIQLAAVGDTVRVYPGTYMESVVIGKELALRAHGGYAVTTIDASGTGQPALTLTGGVSAATVVEGFTITGGYNNPSGVDAGGIVIMGSSPTVTGNRVTGNTGHGMSATGTGTPLFQFNRVTENSGHGFQNWASTGVLWRNWFTDNGKAGIDLANAFPTEIAGNLIARNGSAGIDGTIPSSSKSLLIWNNTIVENQDGIRLTYFANQVTLRRNIIVSNTQFGLTCGSPYSLCPILDQNDVWGNGSLDYNGPVDPSGDISLDPGFRAKHADDFFLRRGSPCLLGGGQVIGAFGEI